MSATCPLDPRIELLRVEALTRVCAALREFKNGISDNHRRALEQLVTAFAEQALGVKRGRYVYAMPCGAGKTQAAVAFIAAAHHLGYGLTFAVAANTIKALALFKRDLMNAGVPEEAIGLRHGKTPKELADDLQGEDVREAARRDTGDEDRPIMLVSHSRLRGKHRALFSQHKGRPRDLAIWDETLFVADTSVMTFQVVRIIASVIEAGQQEAPTLAAFMAHATKLIEAEMAAQGQGCRPSTLDLLPEGIDLALCRAEARKLRASAGGSGAKKGAGEDALSLLRLADLPVSVAMTGGGGDAVIRHETAVDPSLNNVAVLDASHAVRILGRESGVIDGTTDAMRTCKRYDYVPVYQHAVAASKTTQRDYKAAARDIARRVAKIIHETPDGEAVLIVTFKATEKKLRGLLDDEGIDLAAMFNGKPRVSVLTWGQETSTNAYSHCRHVILAGVLRRGLGDLAAALAGERDDPLYRATHERLRELLLSEMAHCVLQAMQRGACRTVDAYGLAGEMTLHIHDSEKKLRAVLADSLPGVRWVIEEPSKVDGLTVRATQAVRDVLAGLPDSVARISARRVKAGALEASGLKLNGSTWTRAIDAATHDPGLRGLSELGADAWIRDGQSLVRASVVARANVGMAPKEASISLREDDDVCAVAHRIDGVTSDQTTEELL